MLKLLVTGGAGFIGSNFIRYILSEHIDWAVTNLDKLTYAGNLENLKGVEDNPRYHFVKGDILDREVVDKLLGKGCDVIVNFAAESHVDRSILDASPFVKTNIEGTQILLDSARQYHVTRFIQISTDEVYGSIQEGRFTEDSPISPNSPYAASKAAAELLCYSYWRTYDIPILITRCSNNYGPFQFPEKLIPLVITNTLENKMIPVYGDGKNIRDWVYVEDHCRALGLVIQQGRVGEIYNISGDNERSNLELVKRILGIMGKPESLMKFVEDRLGHDRRYALDASKIQHELGWRPFHSFEEALSTTVEWYVNGKPWWSRIKSGDYAKYYQKVYGCR